MRTYLFGIAGAGILLVGLFGLYVTIERFQSSRADALQRGDREAGRVAQDLSASIAEGVAGIAQTASSPGLAAAFVTPEGCNLTSAGAGVFSTVHLDLLDPEGRVICSSRPEFVSSDPVYGGQEWFGQIPDADEPVVSGTFVDPLTDSASVAVAAPVFNSDSRFVGSVVAVATWAPVGTDLIASTSARSDLNVVVTDVDAGMILSSSRAPELQGTSLESTDFNRAVSGEFDGLDGKSRLFGTTVVPDSPWRVFVGLGSEAVLQEASSTMRQSIVFWILMLALLSFAVFLANRKIALPLRRLSHAIEVARMDLIPSEISVGGPAEVVDVADEYNEMLRARSDYEERLMHQAMHDSLTDLPNRQLALDRIGQALQKEVRAEELAVLALDLDRFKVLNDSLGHDLGDRILVEVVERLRDAIRPQDTIARFGGDEFVVICDELDGGYQAVGVAEDIQRALRPSFPTSMGPAVLTASIGIAFNQGRSDRPEDLLRDANAAMHRAKDQGRARYEVFDSDLGDRVNDRLRIENDLRRSIEERTLMVHYQPKVDLSENRIVGAEALVRWKHPVRGWVPPNEFIAIAEESGLIVPLGNFVLEEATHQAKRWPYLVDGEIHVAVNLSGRQVLQPDFPKTVTRILESNKVAPERVWLEVTEAVLLHEESPVGDVLGRLSEVGFTMSLDDFGTGYSSLAYLRRFPFKELKIDRAFVQDLGGEEGERALVQAILGMAEALKLDVVAEGIETEDQLRALLDLGCETGQGFLFARPQSAEDFLTMLKVGVTVGEGSSASSQ